MKAIHYMLFAAAAFIHAACCKEETPDNPGTQLRLTSALDAQQRAEHGLDTQLKEGEAVHVWVDDAVSGEELYPNNVLTAGADGALAGGETMYFPATGNAADIYAIHGNFSSTDMTDFWGTEQTHTVMQDQRSSGSGYARSDLVYAKRTNVSPDGNPTTVPLTFTHLLSKVEVVLEQGAGNPSISKVEILNTLLEAKFTPNKADQTITVTASGTKGENPIEIDADLTTAANAAGSDDSRQLLNEATIVPQTLEAGTDFIRITTADGGEQVYSLPANTTFAPGKKYSFAISTEPFGDKTVEDAAVGDYYMADGTVLGQDKTLTPELASKVVGIVFYEGHHDLDNSDYTNTGIGQQKCHGYAVALTDVHNDKSDGLRWEKGPSGEYNRRVGTSINNDWNGYSNSQKFHDFVNDEENKAEGWEMKHFPAANACETYGNRTLDKDGNDANGKYDWQQSLAAPKNSSGWFLPSYGQLSHLGEKKEGELLSTRMNDVKNSISADCDYKDYIKWFSTGSYYWSSTEHPDDTHSEMAMCVCVSGGFLGIYTKDYTRDVRAVLAF